MEWIAIVAPQWLWILAFAGLWLFGGICGALLWHVIRVRPLEHYRDLVERDTLPALWPDPDPE